MLAGLRAQLGKALDWLGRASVDEMVNAMARAVLLDRYRLLALGHRDDRGDEARWRDIGKLAPHIGANPDVMAAALDFFTGLQEQGLILSGALAPAAAIESA